MAYATGEILVALSLVTADPDPYVIPISLAIAALMTIVIVSYRQTVRAYPNGGGAYIVSKENLGAIPGLIAAAALMFDYMMTVVVSIVAGVFAIGSAYPLANHHKVFLSILFVAFITLMNLRGIKESGTLFAIPTYGFIVAIMTMIVVGLVDCLGGCPSVGVDVEPLHNAATAAGAVGVFALLKAFSLGATALTGVEAISNGVPAFRRPQARNAAATLAVMGTLAITMFLGISWLTDARGRCHRERGALRRRPGRDRDLRQLLRGVLRRAGVHRPDPDPRREHGVPGLPATGVDPGARSVSCRGSSSTAATGSCSRTASSSSGSSRA